jgi:hypothetical protein
MLKTTHWTYKLEQGTSEAGRRKRNPMMNGSDYQTLGYFSSVPHRLPLIVWKLRIWRLWSRG